MLSGSCCHEYRVLVLDLVGVRPLIMSPFQPTSTAPRTGSCLSSRAMSSGKKPKLKTIWAPICYYIFLSSFPLFLFHEEMGNHPPILSSGIKINIVCVKLGEKCQGRRQLLLDPNFEELNSTQTSLEKRKGDWEGGAKKVVIKCKQTP